MNVARIDWVEKPRFNPILRQYFRRMLSMMPGWRGRQSTEDSPGLTERAEAEEGTFVIVGMTGGIEVVADALGGLGLDGEGVIFAAFAAEVQGEVAGVDVEPEREE